MARVGGEEREVERRHRAGFPVAKLPGRRLETDVDHAGHNAELVQHIEGRRMKGRSAQLHDRLSLCLEHEGGNAAARQRQRCGKTDGAGAYDDDGISGVGHGSMTRLIDAAT